MNSPKGPVARVEMQINAPAAKVWEALTRPEHIKKYLFGTDTDTDWKPGSAVYFRGTWEGKTYEDKGRVLEAVPGRRLAYTYWSAMSGTPDTPENYKTIEFELAADGLRTRLTMTQDDNPDEEGRAHSEQNWKMVLDGLKKLAEGL